MQPDEQLMECWELLPPGMSLEVIPDWKLSPAEAYELMQAMMANGAYLDAAPYEPMLLLDTHEPPLEATLPLAMLPLELPPTSPPSSPLRTPPLPQDYMRVLWAARDTSAPAPWEISTSFGAMPPLELPPPSPLHRHHRRLRAIATAHRLYDLNMDYSSEYESSQEPEAEPDAPHITASIFSSPPSSPVLPTAWPPLIIAPASPPMVLPLVVPAPVPDASPLLAHVAAELHGALLPAHVAAEEHGAHLLANNLPYLCWHKNKSLRRCTARICWRASLRRSPARASRTRTYLTSAGASRCGGARRASAGERRCGGGA
jgi:hypothetical protein